MQRRVFLARALGAMAAALAGALPSTERLFAPLPPGRLTLTGGRPVYPTDEIGAIYFHPYTSIGRNNLVNIKAWRPACLS